MTTATRGLFSNGRLLWCRVPRPLSGGAPVRRSTGTSDPALAADVLATVRHMARQPSLWDVLEGAAEGRIPLLSLHGHWVRGEVGVLRESAAEAASEAARAAADPDIEPLARRWEAEAVPLLPCGFKQRADYVYQLRCLIPPNVPFHASQWNEDHLQVVLSQQVNARTGAPLSPSTARRYATAWQQFGKWLRKKVTLPHDPFVDGDWIPSNAPPRMIWWEHERRMRFIEALPSEEQRVFAALTLGSGMELTAALSFRCGDLGSDRVVLARGTKNATRVNRSIILDQWADDIVRPYAAGRPAKDSLWRGEVDPAGDGVEVRRVWYETQVALGYVDAPEVSPRTGKLLWGGVEGLHNIHDARHTYAIIRLLGADGEPRQDMKYVAHQLGHANEQMVMRVYAKAGVDQQLRLQEMRRRAVA